jgi:radical SAM superfamily enzyme YgiQ (UPF0313 family)
MPSFSLLYLATPIARRGHEVRYLEGFGRSVRDIVREVEAWSPGLVALTSLTFRWERVLELISALKRLPSPPRVVVGGLHVSALGESAIEESPTLDGVFLGEGEEHFPSLVDALDEGIAPEGIPGVVFRWKGGLIRNPPARDVPDLDALPFPDRTLIDVNAYVPSPLHHRALPNTSLFGARGCPYRCTFCHTDPKIRVRSAESVVDEMEHCARRFGVRDFSIWDDVFSIRRQRVFEICDEIRRRRLDVYWSVNARVEHVDEEMLRAMKGAGCWSVLYGIESANPASLAALGKKTAPEDVERAVRAARRAGVLTLGTFILGIPGEGVEGGLRTIEHACKIGLDYAFFGFLTPFPGTSLKREIDEGKWKGAWVDADRFDIKNVTWVPDGITEGELEGLARTAIRRFYFRPSYLLGCLARLRSLHDVVTYVNAFFHFASVWLGRARTLPTPISVSPPSSTPVTV